ncbi:MAG: hypothetical protein ABIK28_05590 [Planctomycetota bacterium]
MAPVVSRSEPALAALLLAVQLLCACTAGPIIPMPSGGQAALPGRILREANQGIPLDSAEETALLFVAEYHLLSQAIGVELWPGWSAEKIRYAIKVGPDRWLLVNHYDPLPGMDWVMQEIVPYPVFIGSLGMDPAGQGNLPIRGRMTLVLSLKLGEAAMVREEIIGLLFQLSAHQTMGIACALQHGTRLSAPPLIPPAPDQRALRRAEMRLLSRALDAGDDAGCLQEAARYKAVREARRKACNPELYAFEQRMEATEGIALYIRLRALELACQCAQAGRKSLLAENVGAVALYQKYEGILHTHCIQKLEQTASQGYGAGSYGFHITGMAMACLLDRLDPGWKKQLMKKPEGSMESLLFDMVGMQDSADQQERFMEACDICDFQRLVEEERRSVF